MGEILDTFGCIRLVPKYRDKLSFRSPTDFRNILYRQVLSLSTVVFSWPRPNTDLHTDSKKDDLENAVYMQNSLTFPVPTYIGNINRPVVENNLVKSHVCG